MKLSDKYLLSVIAEESIKSVFELYEIIRKAYPHTDKPNIERRLSRLQKRNLVQITKKGNIKLSEAVFKDGTKKSQVGKRHESKRRVGRVKASSTKGLRVKVRKDDDRGGNRENRGGNRGNRGGNRGNRESSGRGASLYKTFSSSEDDFYDICKRYSYRLKFRAKELKEAEETSNKILEEEVSKRADFRSQLAITIDGEDAKDLDDAVYLIPKTKDSKDGYKLYVHIADVSYYVKENTNLDKEALRRGNSVYLIDKVVPMLPPSLSNIKCSLNANEDKLGVSVEIDFDKNANVLNYKFHESIIRVSKRYSYEQIDKLLYDKNLKTEDKAYINQLKLMYNLSQKLKSKRLKENSVIFNFKELSIVCDTKSNPKEIYRKEPLKSYSIIEEFMLSANKVVAKYLSDGNINIYRTHGEPDKDKITTFGKMLSQLGYKVKNPQKLKDQQELQKILDKFAGHNAEKLVNITLLKSMQQACYSVENTGHYALGFEYYTHFTSPIRRYCDLVVHRLLKARLNAEYENSRGELGSGFKKGARGNKGNTKKISAHFKAITKHISETERTAISSERDIIKKKSARFMKDKVGLEFGGTISGVSDFGLFVELAPYGIEGLVRISDLEGYYMHNEEEYSLERKDKNISYRLGDKIKVRLVSVDVERTFIDLIPTSKNKTRNP